MKFHLDNNIVEGTPEELVKYHELLEEKEALLKSGHMHVGYQPSEEEFQDTFRGIFGSMKVKDSYIGSTEISTDEAEEDIKGYTFWYIDGTQGRNLNVLKATLDGDFEDSTGTRYTYQAVHGLVKPLDREDVREKFEKAENYGCLLKYYPTVDVFACRCNSNK